MSLTPRCPLGQLRLGMSLDIDCIDGHERCTCRHAASLLTELALADAQAVTLSPIPHTIILQSALNSLA